MFDNHTKEDVQQRIFQWICPVDVELLHRRARSVCQTGTGSWFIDGLFQQWLLEENKCQLLYLEGKCRYIPSNRAVRILILPLSWIREDCPLVFLTYRVLIMENLTFANTVRLR